MFRRGLTSRHAEACRLLLEYRPQLDALVESLLERETLDEQEILNVTGLPRSPAPVRSSNPHSRQRRSGVRRDLPPVLTFSLSFGDAISGPLTKFTQVCHSCGNHHGTCTWRSSKRSARSRHSGQSDDMFIDLGANARRDPNVDGWAWQRIDEPAAGASQ